MLTKVLIFALIVLLTVHQSTGQASNPSCTYFVVGGSYTCLFAINNPTGRDNFTAITGQHLPGYGDSDVDFVVVDLQAVSTIVPRIICDTFQNTWFMLFDHSGVEEIGSNAFRNCSGLRRLELQDNRINRIATNAFVNNPQFEWIDLTFNHIQELPANLFRPLIRLNQIRLSVNRINVVHANWFGFLPNVTALSIENNGIKAIDRRIMEALPNVLRVDMTGNACATGLMNIADMIECFDNYDDLMSQCVIGDINQEVCSLRSEVNVLEDRVRILERIIAGFEKKFERLEAQKH